MIKRSPIWAYFVKVQKLPLFWQTDDFILPRNLGKISRILSWEFKRCAGVVICPWNANTGLLRWYRIKIVQGWIGERCLGWGYFYYGELHKLSFMRYQHSTRIQSFTSEHFTYRIHPQRDALFRPYFSLRLPISGSKSHVHEGVVSTKSGNIAIIGQISKISNLIAFIPCNIAGFWQSFFL